MQKRHLLVFQQPVNKQKAAWQGTGCHHRLAAAPASAEGEKKRMKMPPPLGAAAAEHPLPLTSRPAHCPDFGNLRSHGVGPRSQRLHATGKACGQLAGPPVTAPAACCIVL